MSRKRVSSSKLSGDNTKIRKRPFKNGEIVLVKSRAGSAIPNIHIKLIKRIEVKPSKGTRMDWPGYVGWESEMVLQEEIDMLRQKFGIPFQSVGDKTFVYEEDIIKRVRKKTDENVKRVSETVIRRKKKSGACK